MVKWKASHILVKKQSEAQDILKKLKKGEKFKDLARKLSECPSGKKGGSLGWFGPGQMVRPFQDAVNDLSKGEVSDPVKTRFGYHIIRLDDKKG